MSNFSINPDGQQGPTATAAPRLARNASLNLAAQAVPLATAVVAIPIVLSNLGIERFGTLALLWALLAYAALFDLGLQRATTFLAATELKRGKEDTLASILSGSLLLTASAGLAVGLALILAAQTLTLLIGTAPEHIGETLLSFQIVAAAMTITVAITPLRGILEASQRFDLLSAITTTQNVLMYALPAAGSALGLGLSAITLLLLATRLAGAIALLVTVNRLYPRTLPTAKFDPQTIRALLSFGSWTALSSLVAPALIYADRFIVGLVAGAAAIAFYTAPFELATRLWIVPSAIAMSLFPVVSAGRGARPSELVVRLYVRTAKLALLVVAVPALLLIVAAEAILFMWLGPDFASESVIPLRILAAGVLINSAAWVPVIFVQGIGRPDLVAKLQLLEVAPFILVSWLLVESLGIAGAALAWALRATVDAVLVFALAAQGAGVSADAYREHGALRAMVIVGLFATVAIATGTVASAQFVWVAAILAGYCLAAWKWGMDDSDRATVRRALHAVWDATLRGGPGGIW